MMPTRMSSLPGRGSRRRGSPRPLKRLSQAEGLKARRDVHRVWERVPTAAVLLRRRDDGRRSAAGPHRDGPVPSPRGRSDADRFVPGDRGVGMGGEAGHPGGPRQGRLGTDMGFRPPRESPPVRPDVPHRACDEVEADRLGHGEAEVLLVHETVPRPGAGLVMLNRGTFTGSSLHTFADKESGARVPKMYREGLFPEIIDYVTRERDAAMDLLKESRDVIGDLGDRRRRPLHKNEAKP